MREDGERRNRWGKKKKDRVALVFLESGNGVIRNRKKSRELGRIYHLIVGWNKLILRYLIFFISFFTPFPSPH